MKKGARGRTEFGERMWSARTAAGLTQKQVCSALGIAQSTLSELETSATKSGFVVKFAKLYQVSADWLSTGEGLRRPIPNIDDKGIPSVAHGMSLDVHTVPSTLTWGDLMTIEKLPAAFRLVMRDNSMAPTAGAGATVEFTTDRPGQVGDAVLVKDSQGRYHFREMCELAEGWEARPTNPAFARLNSREHGLTVVAVFSGVARVGSWSDLTR